MFGKDHLFDLDQLQKREKVALSARLSILQFFGIKRYRFKL